MSNKKKNAKDTSNNRGMGGGFGPGGNNSVEKAKDFKGTMKQLLHYLKPYRIAIIIAMIFAIGSTVFTIVGPKVLGDVTTDLAKGFMAKVANEGAIDFVSIQQTLIILLGIYILSFIFSYIQGYLMAGISQKVTYQMRKSLSEKIDRMPLKYFDTRTHGEILSRVTNDVDTLATSLSSSLSQLITSLTQIIGVVVMMFTISWQMTLVTLLVVPLTGVFGVIIVKLSQKYFISQQVYLGHVNGHVEEMYGGHMIMKAFNGEQRSVEKFEDFNNTLYKSAWKSQFLSGLMFPISQFIGNLGYVGVCILGGYLAFTNAINIGDIQSFFQYIRLFNQPITQLAQISNVLQSTAAAAERVFEFLAEQEEEPDANVDVVPVIDESGKSLIEGNVTFDHVRFGYDPDKTIIHDFSAEVKEGETVAIVGPTGAGKTTIVKLLMRFYDVDQGGIYIDGHNTKSFKRDDLRSLFGMVLQDAWLFEGTIKENLRFGKFDATDEEIQEAADMAYVDHFIRTLEHGYDTVIDEDSDNISQGQKQLLTIARAFLKDPKILILDEATSSVDTRTEVLIQKGMTRLMEGRTSFVIAHRLSTIRNADKILVMREGDIVEIGTHDSLIAENGFYAQLYNSQFEE